MISSNVTLDETAGDTAHVLVVAEREDAATFKYWWKFYSSSAHLFPFRTEKLRLSAPMVLCWCARESRSSPVLLEIFVRSIRKKMKF